MSRTGIFNIIAHYMDLARIRRREVRTIRLLASLPPEIQADIGWPDLQLDGMDRFARAEATLAETRIAALPRTKGWVAPPIPPQCPA